MKPLGLMLTKHPRWPSFTQPAWCTAGFPSSRHHTLHRSLAASGPGGARGAVRTALRSAISEEIVLSKQEAGRVGSSAGSASPADHVVAWPLQRGAGHGTGLTHGVRAGVPLTRLATFRNAIQCSHGAGQLSPRTPFSQSKTLSLLSTNSPLANPVGGNPVLLSL